MTTAVPTMKEVDAHRAESSRYALASHPADRVLDPEEYESYRDSADHHAAQVDAGLAARNTCPRCPFCANGVLAEVPTQGTRRCVDCGALALRTAGEALMHTGGVA